MLKKFLPLVAGAALLTLASAASAAQPLSDTQMDSVTAGAALGAIAEAGALSFGEFQADTLTQTSTNVVHGNDINPFQWIAVGQSHAQAAATGGALFQTAVQVHSATQAVL